MLLIVRKLSDFPQRTKDAIVVCFLNDRLLMGFSATGWRFKWFCSFDVVPSLYVSSVLQMLHLAEFLLSECVKCFHTLDDILGGIVRDKICND